MSSGYQWRPNLKLSVFQQSQQQQMQPHQPQQQQPQPQLRHQPFIQHQVPFNQQQQINSQTSFDVHRGSSIHSRYSLPLRNHDSLMNIPIHTPVPSSTTACIQSDAAHKSLASNSQQEFGNTNKNGVIQHAPISSSNRTTGAPIPSLNSTNNSHLNASNFPAAADQNSQSQDHQKSLMSAGTSMSEPISTQSRSFHSSMPAPIQSQQSSTAAQPQPPHPPSSTSVNAQPKPTMWIAAPSPSARAPSSSSQVSAPMLPAAAITSSAIQASSAPQNIWANSKPRISPTAVAASNATGQQLLQSSATAASSSSSKFGQSNQASSSASANAAFMARFQAQPAPTATAAPAPAAPKNPSAIPLCKGHNAPMQSRTSRKPGPNEGQMFWQCYLYFSNQSQSCNSFVWDRELHTRKEFRYAQVGANGEVMIEVQFDLEVANESQFTASISPPNEDASQFLRQQEGAIVDEKACTDSFLKLHPRVWLFPLSNYDSLVHSIEKQKQVKSLWRISEIPVPVRTLLLKEMQMERLQKYEAAIAATIAASQVSSVSAASSSSNAADADEVRIMSASKKKRGTLLQPKRKPAAADTLGELSQSQSSVSSSSSSGAVDLTVEEETKLNPDKLAPCLRNTLLPFQMEGVEYLISKGGRGLLADEMGLGKTLQSLAVVSYYWKKDWPLLIICPSSLRLNWENEIQKFLPFISPESIFVILSSKDGKAVLTQSTTSKKVQGRRFSIIIISYDLAPTLLDELKKYKFGCIICDESHAIKNNTTQRAKTAMQLIKTAKRAILLSGTPALNRPMELHTQISSLKPNLFAGHKDFGMRYCAGHLGPFGMDYKGASHLQELNVLLKKYVLLRREKSSVLQQLPSKRRQAIQLDVPKKDMAELRKVEYDAAQLQEELQNASSGRQANVHLMQMFQLTGVAKLNSVCSYIDNMLDEGLKFLVFAHHIRVLSGVEEHVRRHPTFPSYIRIDGSTPAVKRNDLVKQFQEDDNCRIAILSIQAAGTGLTLTAASNVVFAELLWTPASLAQAEDRVHRIGQSSAVNIHYLLAKGTLDDLVWPLVHKKLSVIGRAVSGEDFHMEIDENKDFARNENLDEYFGVDEGAAGVMLDEEALRNETEEKDSPHQNISDELADNIHPDHRIANAGLSSKASSGKPRLAQDFFGNDETTIQGNTSEPEIDLTTALAVAEVPAAAPAPSTSPRTTVAFNGSRRRKGTMLTSRFAPSVATSAAVAAVDVSSVKDAVEIQLSHIDPLTLDESCHVISVSTTPLMLDDNSTDEPVVQRKRARKRVIEDDDDDDDDYDGLEAGSEEPAAEDSSIQDSESKPKSKSKTLFPITQATSSKPLMKKQKVDIIEDEIEDRSGPHGESLESATKLAPPSSSKPKPTQRFVPVVPQDEEDDFL